MNVEVDKFAWTSVTFRRDDSNIPSRLAPNKDELNSADSALLWASGRARGVEPPVNHPSAPESTHAARQPPRSLFDGLEPLFAVAMATHQAQKYAP